MIAKLTLKRYFDPEPFAIGFLWLVHVAAVIGISLGFKDWFAEKTPFNLLLILGIMVWFYPMFRRKTIIAFGVIFITGMLAELIGVNTGLLFGDYVYGSNLGPKVGGVPLLIGINWALLVLCSAEIAKSFKVPFFFQAIIGATLMVFLDFFIEPVAPILDFWLWNAGEAPFFNFITWFILALLLNLFYISRKIDGDRIITIHVYLTQLVFFACLYVANLI